MRASSPEPRSGLLYSTRHTRWVPHTCSSFTLPSLTIFSPCADVRREAADQYVLFRRLGLLAAKNTASLLTTEIVAAINRDGPPDNLEPRAGAVDSGALRLRLHAPRRARGLRPDFLHHADRPPIAGVYAHGHRDCFTVCAGCTARGPERTSDPALHASWAFFSRKSQSRTARNVARRPRPR